jgi:thiamine-phosphate pyrophosphorylase
MFPRLYAILDIDLVTARGLEPLAVLDQWLDAGVRLIQIRAKTLGSQAFLALVEAALKRTRAAGARLIVNDRADVAAMANADGVHVGQDDLPPAAARAVVGSSVWVGVSTHDDVQVDAAAREPVTYLAIGPVYATKSKAAPDPVVGIDGVRRAAARAKDAGLPLVAIGGITLDRAPEVMRGGATAVAVISDLITPDPGARAREFLTALGAID